VGVSHQSLQKGLERYTSQFLLLMVGGGGRSSKSTKSKREEMYRYIAFTYKQFNLHEFS
jgi:hypothetical protein